MTDTIDSRPHWFVGALWHEDQTERFLAEGIWQNGYTDKFLELVKSAQPGERIAIKTAYTRKHGVPFETNGNTVSVMGVKVIGTIVENLGDGRTLKVDWDRQGETREWYFYTFRTTISRVLPDDWKSEALIAFAFHGAEQNVDRFRNAPFWKERFGDAKLKQHHFPWISFFEEMASRLLEYRDRRDELLHLIRALAQDNELSYLDDRDHNKDRIPLDEVCPFTVMGIFNRGLTLANRIDIAQQLRKILDIEAPVPLHFDGVPLINNQNSCFYSFKYERKLGDIDKLWEIFAQALHFADSGAPTAKENFIKAYDDASPVKQVAWNLTMGLFWIRPWVFPTLDSRSRDYIEDRIKLTVPNKPVSGEKYLELKEALEARFQEDEFSVHSFPDLSLTAWQSEDAPLGEHSDDEIAVQAEHVDKPTIKPYSVEKILDAGCFLEKEQLDDILANLRRRKNLILQGPPGVGKTWLARRLAYALMGQEDWRRVRSVQFHPNLSYEDFIRGWRPSGDGKLTLSDGPFLQAVTQALDTPNVPFVVVVEEINRGNPASIFGEMLTLLEADKRKPAEALELCYRISEGERIYVPSNLYLIGTMNIADRSLALVDLALRRRFAFVDLLPILGNSWLNWVHTERGIPKAFLTAIRDRLLALNSQIANDTSLGRQFQIGHSYVTPGIDYGTDPAAWYRQVVETQIGPLLDEYWFDDSTKAKEAKESLLSGL